MADDVVKQFNLQVRYETTFMQDTRSRLEGVTRVTVNKEKVIKVTVEDKDAAVAAEMQGWSITMEAAIWPLPSTSFQVRPAAELQTWQI